PPTSSSPGRTPPIRRQRRRAPDRTRVSTGSSGSTTTRSSSCSSGPRRTGPTRSAAPPAWSCRDTSSSPSEAASRAKRRPISSRWGPGPIATSTSSPGTCSSPQSLHTPYHAQNRPYFDTVEMTGGGDPVSAARAVLQTGEYDYAWGVQMEHEILRRLEQSPKGRFVIRRTPNVEYIQLNQTDPSRDVDGERSSVKTKHPFLTDPAVRSAFALLVDRESIQKDIWGRQADVTANFMNRPPFVSPNTRWEFNVDKANAILDAAGWKRGADGIRAKNGTRLKVLFQGVNQPIRQKMQSVVKQACVRAGIDCELKSVVGSVYFSSDPGNADTGG